MATAQNLSEVVSQSKLTVVAIPKQRPQTITRTELVLYLSLKGRLQQLEGQLKRRSATFQVR